MCGILAESAVVFLVCLTLHVMAWRIRRPTRYRAWLPTLAVTFLLFGAGFGWWLIGSRLILPDETRPDALTEWVAVMLLHGASSTVYIIGYTLLTAVSPSIEILKRLDGARDGLRQDEIDVPYLRTAVGGERVSNLIADGLLVVEGGAVRLAPRARTLALMALVYRHAVGLPDGTGG